MYILFLKNCIQQDVSEGTFYFGVIDICPIFQVQQVLESRGEENILGGGALHHSAYFVPPNVDSMDTALVGVLFNLLSLQGSNPLQAMVLSWSLVLHTFRTSFKVNKHCLTK